MVVAAVLLGVGFAIFALVRNRPQDLPWTKLGLADPPGLFTGRKLVALGNDFSVCRALLERAGVRTTALPALRPAASPQCGYDAGIRLGGGARTIAFSPRGLGTSCPVAAALVLWEWNVVQPAANRIYGSRVATIEHFGSYNCRRLYGRSSGDYSQHATANAIDVAGFVLANGQRISIVGDWQGQGDDARFLREVRDGACPLFATVLSPDYNAAHRDHFHLDQANRGTMGWRACR
jgi:hypothetical protein